MSEPFLFDELEDDPALAPPAVQVYTSPIEQATFDIMEAVDAYFRASITVEEYDEAQKKVKKILTEAFDESPERKTAPCSRALLVRPEDD